MKASKRINKYLLIATVILVQVFVSGFGLIPVTGDESTASDILIDPIQSNPGISTNTIDPSREEGRVELQNFVESVVDGTSEAIRGIYSEEVMEYPVIQQPSGQPGYVSQISDVVNTVFDAEKIWNYRNYCT